jgi:hypothetical protein
VQSSKCKVFEKGLHPLGLSLIFLLLAPFVSSQHLHQTIHYEQNEYYKQFGRRNSTFYDSLNGFKGRVADAEKTLCQLQKIVFGFHPYWAGSDYLNYQWNLVSDLCYFSYEVDPSTGDPVTIHDWLTDPAIDSAQANGVRVHLCATIFSGHTSFFNNPAARQNLIDNLVLLVQQRNADGINMDIEALPSSVSDSLTVFMEDLSVQLKTAIPDALLSIDLPAVDWGSNFQITSLTNFVDYFFIMGYDYYYNGTALTYSVVRNNSAIYNSSNYTWEQNSFSSCYIFFQNDNWNQCFIGLEHDLRKKYDIVNYRDLAGIGIWALGYDDGYTELWQAISDKFTDCYLPLTYDTIFDSGGPTWNYYGNENYTLTIDHGHNDLRYLSFTSFNLETPFDSLWLYAGPDTTFSLLGGFSGTSNPGTISSPNGVFTLKFKSDGIYNFSGWSAVFHDGSMGVENHGEFDMDVLLVYPNPAYDILTIPLPEYEDSIRLSIIDRAGKLLLYRKFVEINNRMEVEIDVSHLPPGSFIIILEDEKSNKFHTKFIKMD